MLQLKENSRVLRSSDKFLLSVPKTRLKTVGDKAFCAYAPKLWNSLPHEIKVSNNVKDFKVKLKTYLFRQAYDL